MTRLGNHQITYRILHFKGRPWWWPKWEVHLTVSGLFELASAGQKIRTRHYTKRSAKRLVERVAAHHDFKVVESATLIHE